MAQEVVLTDFRQSIFSNAIITASGSQVASGFGVEEIILIINVTGPVTGTTPSLTFQVQEVDPGNQTTPIGQTATGTAITGISTQIIHLPVSSSGDVLVSWTVTGTTPSFGGVYVNALEKDDGSSILYDPSGNLFGVSGNPLKIDPSGSTIQPVSGTIIANQGTAAATSSAWPVKITDGTNTTSVKPASTAAAATDSSIVVALSPNSPVPAGSNVIGTVTAQQNTAANLLATVTQGSGNATIGNAWYEKLTDGTNGPVAVKPASTAAVATDPALVVAISPNNPISTSSTLLSDRIVSNTIAILNASVSVSAQGVGDVGITITGSWSATLTFQGTIDGTNWFTVYVFPNPILNTSVPVSATTANAQFTIPTAGLNQFRVTATAYTSGSATVTLEGNQASSNIAGIVTVEQGTAANLNATITGTVTADAGTGTFSENLVQVAGNSVITVASGVIEVGIVGHTGAMLDAAGQNATAPTNQLLVGGQFNTTPTTITSGNMSPLQLDANGNLLVNLKTEIPTGTNTIGAVNQGVGTGTIGNAWFQKITDGTNGPVAVKAPSTAAVAADPSLVTAFSPNSPLPTGTNSIGTVIANQGTPTANASAWPVKLYDASGNALSVQDGVTIPASTSSLLAATVDDVSGNATNLRSHNKILKVNEYDTELQVPGKVTIQGARLTAAQIKLFGGIFPGSSLDTTVWAPSTSGSGSVTVGNGQVVLDTGATANSFTKLESLYTLPFDTETPNEYSATVSLGDTGAANNVRRWGAYDDLNGAFFQVNGTTFQVGTRFNGTDTLYSSFNGDSTFTLDTNFHDYDIYYLAGEVHWFVDEVLLNSIVITNAPWAQTLDLYLYAENINSGGLAASYQISFISLSGYRLGPLPAIQINAGPQITDASLTNLVKAVMSGKRPDGNYGNAFLDNNNIQVVGDLPYAIAAGVVPGGYTDQIYGFNRSGRVGQLMATAYTEQTTATIRSLKSASANDTAAGSGAQQVTITGYDGSMNALTEVVTLNGTTAVATTNSYRFFEKIQVSRVGSGGGNAGVITLYVNNAGAGGTIGTIGFHNVVSGAGDNQTFWGHHYVRAGKICYVMGMSGDFAGVEYNGFCIRSSQPLSSGPDIQIGPQFGTRYAQVYYPFNVPLLVPGQSKIRLFRLSISGHFIAGSFEFAEF